MSTKEQSTAGENTAPRNYAADADFVVTNYDMDKIVPPANEVNLQPVPEKIHQKITKIFSANYALIVIVIILLIAIIKFEGLIADVAVVLMALGAFYFVFLQISKKEK
jgi:hypothetical protein